MTLYKVLGPDGQSLYGGRLVWSLPTQQADGSWLPGAWHEVPPPIVVCERGLHLTTEPYGHWITWDDVVYEAEGEGEHEAEDDKIAFQRVRLLRPAPVPAWWTAVHRFVEQDMLAIPWLRPDGEPDPAWRLVTGSTWEAAHEACRVALYKEGRGRHVGYNEAYDAAAKMVHNALMWAKRSAAYNAAGDVIANAFRQRFAVGLGYTVAAMSYRAARDASLYAACVHLCAGVALDPAHVAHARARWHVWEKGYALMGDANGVLFVCAKDEAR